MSAAGERCEVCGEVLFRQRSGRPARYCSNACLPPAR